MTDHTLARADEVLTDLVELVETARSLPMSSSCVVPRERTLDLLDALREVLPPEMLEARRIVANSERMLADAAQRAEDVEQAAVTAAQARIASAAAEAEAIVADARAEHARLVSADAVHQAAEADAARMVAEARAAADDTTARTQDYTARLSADAHAYAERTLTELIQTLTRLSATAENGRAALAARTQAEEDADGPAPAAAEEDPAGWSHSDGGDPQDTPVFVDPAAGAGHEDEG